MKINRAVFSLLISTGLGWVILPSEASAFQCQTALQYFVGINLEQIPHFSKKNKIGQQVARDLSFLRHEVKSKFTGLPNEQRQDCIAQAQSFSEELRHFVIKRLEYLIERREWASFNLEYQWLFAPLFDGRHRQQLERDLSELQESYLSQLTAEFLDELKTSPWQRWSQLDFCVTSWTPDWSTLFERDAPAGVNFLTRQIAVRPFLYDSDSLKVFLFHELAHLADPQFAFLDFHDSEPNYQNELFAWQQTIEYALWKNFAIIPKVITTVNSGIEKLGIEEWVMRVLRGR